MRCLRSSDPNLDIEQVLRLDLNIDEELEFPVIWMLASVLLIIWNLRITKSRIQLYEVRTQLGAKVNLLRETTTLDQLVGR